jgi:hypothetical protein
MLSEWRFRPCCVDRTARFSSVGLHCSACSHNQAKPTPLGLYHRNCYQDVVGWPHPFYRHRVTIFRWTNDAQRPVSTCAHDHVDFPAGNDFAANQAITFFIQRVPLPESIESLQEVQLVSIGQFDRRNKRHRPKHAVLRIVIQSGERRIGVSVKILAKSVGLALACLNEVTCWVNGPFTFGRGVAVTKLSVDVRRTRLRCSPIGRTGRREETNEPNSLGS